MRIVLLLIGLFLATEASAQTRAISDAEASRWRAVGVMAVNRFPICTATLIAPDLVLTAAHCVYAGGRTRPLPPDAVEFRAGWRNGSSVVRRQAVRITAHRAYQPQGQYDARNVAVDIALIQIAPPVKPDEVAPLPTLNRLRQREKVDLVSYGQGRMDHPSIHEGCSLLDRSGDVLRLTCESVPGTSGAPVFTMVNGKPRIVSLISGAITFRTGHQIALGVAFDRALARLMSDRSVLSNIGAQTAPFWDTGPVVRARALPPPPQRRIVKPGGALNLPQN